MLCRGKSFRTLVILYICNFLDFAVTLQQGDKGVCVATISVQKMRGKLVPSPSGKRCGTKICTVKIIEHYSSPEQRVICCNGWEYDVSSDTCAPVCTTGCVGGRCVAPDMCHCDPPRYLDPEHRNACIEPTCDPPCVNAKCGINNTCTCNTNYTRFNSSHCAICNRGYEVNENFECAPVCENCPGVCLAPNLCKCPNTHKMSREDFSCIPKCEGRCKNGTCESNTEKCICNPGFIKSAHDAFVCEKNCELPTEIEQSVQKLQFQKFPAKVKCPKKYTDCTKKESQAQKTPKNYRCCKTKVQRKEMVASCCPGWEYSKKEVKCKATCGAGCLNGTCIAPDHCQCDKGLLLINKNQCVLPFCEKPCVNGICVANDTCECNPGFNFYNSTHCMVVCETGHVNNPVTLECEPKCDSPCVNGTCKGPNHCSCIDGHVRKDDYTCVPHCDPECEHGHCISPNTCSCFNGYRFEGNNTSICNPVCDVCEYGDCVAPNMCRCHEGYALQGGRCGPVCDEACNNGDCSEPNVCKCYEGYEIDHLNKFNCLPKCNECQNGICVKPNECKCNPGFTKVNGTCEPVCTKSCQNGFCSAPDECTCNANYTLSSTDKFSCVPVCEPNCINSACTSPNTCSCLTGYEPTEDNHICKPKCISCVHGECVAPNVCRCHEGYIITDDRCSPVCKLQCINGACTAPNECTCNDGYENKYNSSICQKPCMSACDHGVCSLHGICRCDRGYQLLNDTCTPIPPVDCKECKSDCSSGSCWCPDGETPCEYAAKSEMYDTTTTTSLAGMQLPWTLGGVIVLILVTMIIVVILRISRKRKDFLEENVEDAQMDRLGSVMYTVSNNSIHKHDHYDDDDHKGDDGAKHQDEDIKNTELTPL
ncbi:hypothetical protein O0L34_g4439 [Tuta absoluta]|nr:hypothetical protein O0L34_g4439 [Tuta absoluta]